MKKRFFYLSGEDGNMQDKCGDSRCNLWLIWATCILTMLGDAVLAQTHLRQRDFLNLGSTEGYLNYGRSEYEPYPELISARNRYDRLGNFQMRGHKTFTWQLQRPGYSEISTRSEQYLGW